MKLLAASAGAALVLLAISPVSDAQPAVNAQWPMCATPASTFCIASATRDNEPVDGANNGPYEGGSLVAWAMMTDPSTVSWGMNWSLDESSLPGSVGGSVLAMTLRMGNVRPMYTLARSLAFRVDNVASNAAGNWEATFTGSPVVADWRVNSLNPNCFSDPDACEPTSVTADTRRRMWLGQTDNMSSGWDDASRSMFGGMYISSNAQYVQRVVESGKLADGGSFWALRLANPHVAIDARNTSGEFSAFIPDGFFTVQAGITAASAAQSGMVANVVTVEWKQNSAGQWGGEQIYRPINSGSKLYTNGVYTRITQVGYSSPKLTFNTKTGGYINSAVPNVVPPDPPVLTGLSQASGIVTIAYRPPVFDGNSVINGYIAYCEQDNNLYYNSVDQGFTRAIAVAGMKEGTAYCWVKSKNEGGESLESETVMIGVGESPPVWTEAPKSTPTKSTTSLFMPPTQVPASTASGTRTLLPTGSVAATKSVKATSTVAATSAAATSKTTTRTTTTSTSTSAGHSAVAVQFVFVALSAVVAAVAIAL